MHIHTIVIRALAEHPAGDGLSRITTCVVVSRRASLLRRLSCPTGQWDAYRYMIHDLDHHHPSNGIFRFAPPPQANPPKTPGSSKHEHPTYMLVHDTTVCPASLPRALLRTSAVLVPLFSLSFARSLVRTRTLPASVASRAGVPRRHSCGHGSCPVSTKTQCSESILPARKSTSE